VIRLGLVLFVASRRYVTSLETPKQHICAGFGSGEGHLHCLNLGITTVYLLKGTDGYLLIDTGYPGNYDKFRDALGQSGVTLNQIKCLLLTHSHDDHVGFAARIIEETDARLIVHENAVPALSQGAMALKGIRPLNWRVTLLGAIYMLFADRDFNYPPLAVGQEDIVVQEDDDQVLREFGIDGEIVYTPGHTDDSITVVMADGRVFCGDAAMNFLNAAGTHHRPIFVTDEALVFESWRRIVAKGARVLYPAHGEPFGVESLIESLDRYAKLRKSIV
jgi:glyoxylase-like metal-dependent hydrolase (beta-lactamase superfamily II)